MIRKLYPNGKPKAFNISYDDGVTQDVRFVELLNRYGLKGTFNLNSGLMEEQFQWTHESGLVVKRLPQSVAATLYEGHEVASHTLTHPYMHDLTCEQILEQMCRDKENLETLTGKEVSGFAVPFTYYSELIAECAREAGFTYARISEQSNHYHIPKDPYWWRAGKFHWEADLDAYVDSFLMTNHELALCQIVGHSYDLDVYKMWDKMEAILRRVSQNPEVIPMTNLELARYAAAMNRAVITHCSICNPGSEILWFSVDGNLIHLDPGQTYHIQEG